MPKIDNSIKGDMAVKLIAELGGVVATAKLCQIASSSVCSEANGSSKSESYVSSTKKA